MNELRAILAQGAVEASAPCRIDMGGTLDLSTFHLPLRHLGPCTFNAALDMRTTVRLSPYSPGKIKIISRGFESLEVESAQAPFSHPLGLIMAVAAYFQADGVHIEIDSASPPRSALGGSSVAAVALDLGFCQGLESRWATHARASIRGLAGPCHRAERGRRALRDSGSAGRCLWGRERLVLAGRTGRRAFERREVVAPASCADFSKHLLVAYCGVPHVSKDINGTWVREFLSGRQRAEWRQIAALSRQFIEAMAGDRYDEAVALMNRETDLRLGMTPEVLDDVGRPLGGRGPGARLRGALYGRRRRRLRMGFGPARRGSKPCARRGSDILSQRERGQDPGYGRRSHRHLVISMDDAT